MTPEARYALPGPPDALGDAVGASARPQLPDHAVGNVANRFKSVSSRRAYAARPPGRASARVARPFPFTSRPDADDLPHVVASVKPSVFVADEDGNADGTKCWTENLTEKSCQMSL